MFGITAVLATSTTIIAMLWITTLTQSAAQNTSGIELDKTIEWKNYNSTRLGLSIDYPSTWNVQEKQNRFDVGRPDLTIESYEEAGPNRTIQLIDSDFISFAVMLDREATATFTDKNITALTNSIMDQTLDYDTHLIEGVNISRYKIGGENAGSFIVIQRSSDSDSDYLGLPGEQVVTVHNNQVYQFLFTANAEVFDTQRVTEIRKHMFDSIKWSS